MYISSHQNIRIKELLKLSKSNERRQTGLFTVEGVREFEKALEVGYEFESVFFCSEIIDLTTRVLIDKVSSTKLVEVSKDVFQKVAYRENTGGIIGIGKQRKHQLSDVKLKPTPLILVIEGVEKPGNIGAIYRTADAAGVDAVIICDPLADLYNPNAIRASIGTTFTVQTAISTTREAIKYLKSNDIKIFTTYLDASVPYHTADFNQASAIVVGTEATGISKDWLEASEQNIIIPMKGAVDSLNVSVSTAIVLFEACRQRNFS